MNYIAMLKKHIFPNGLELIYQSSIQSIPISCIYILCKVGSAYEKGDIRGISHLVEHMCFTGTKNKKVKNLLYQYNKIGSDVNGHTTKQFTYYNIKTDDNHFEESYNIMIDLLLHSTFPKKEFIKEQQIIIQENTRNMNNHTILMQNLIESMYYKGSSYEYPIDSIEYDLNYNDVLEWYKLFYVPSNMTISIVSQIPFSTILKIVSNSEIATRITHKSSVLKTLSLLPIHDSIVYYPKKGMQTTMIQIGFRTCDYMSKDRYSLIILQSIMNGLSGKLFNEFRTKYALTYNTSCNVDFQEHTGYFSLLIETDRKNAMFTFSILINLINEIKSGISDNDIYRARHVLKGALLRSMEIMDTFALYNSIESLYTKKIIPYQDLYSRYARITKKQVNDVINRYFIRENIVVCIMYDKYINKNNISTLFEKLRV